MAATANNNPATAAATATATAAAAAAATLSPRSPSSVRPVARTGSPPWTQIVRGPESESVGAPSSAANVEQSSAPVVEIPTESSDYGGDGGNAGNMKPAWNKNPSNWSGPVVMGADGWPPLSESTKASPKLSPADSPKNPPDFGSVLSPQKPMTSNANHGRPTRQKSMKRDGGISSQANGGFSHRPSPSEEDPLNPINNSSVKPSFGGNGSEGSVRDNAQSHTSKESGPRSASGDHTAQPHNAFRRGNGGPHSRGDGSHQNYGGRRGDQDRGNHDWNHRSRSFNGRDAAPMQHRGGPRGFVRHPPPVSGPFVHPSMRPYMNPMGIPDMQMVYLPPGVPFVAPMPAPMFYPAVDPQLLTKIVNQIDYYFSNENLIKDTYLRQNMDEHGWVPIGLVANFKKVMQLTENIQLILDAVRSSTIVEAQGDKIRRRDDWMRWIMPPSVQFPTLPGSPSSKAPNVATLSAHMQSVTLDEKTIISPSLITKDGESSSGC